MVSMRDSFSNIGFPPILQPSLNSSGNNATAVANDTASSPFPAGIMDNLLLTAGRSSPILQVALFVYRVLGTHFGLDPSILLTVLGFLWGLSKLGSQLFSQISNLVDRHLMCAMYVSEGDSIYTHMMKWLSEHPVVAGSQYLTAQTVWKSAWEDEEENWDSLELADGGEGDGMTRYLNFANQEARLSPRYVPAPGSTSFWHKGRYFKVTRKKESLITGGWSGTRDVEELRIACFGRSIGPIKRLLAEAKQLYYHDTTQKTTIYRPKAKEVRRDWNMWHTVARRPVRPMGTVVLNAKEKQEVLSDVNEYLHPSTPRWYASRGIPLRRGYLFHGPPGTGKTSFSFALAGVFGLDIYVISLQDINVTEEDLAVLFTKLPRRCIVLLEDIDTAGLQRDSADDDKEDKKTTDEKEDEKEKKEDDKEKQVNGEVNGVANAKVNGTVNGEVNGVVKEDGKDKDSKAKDSKDKKSKRSKKKKHDSSSEDDSDSSSSEEDRKKRRKRSRRDRESLRRGLRDHGLNRAIMKPESISLSGLLNAIDGVASHEGRVLIMTTNKPESLDDALIRPGRVDLQVAFQNATSEQAGELFRRMYEGSRARVTKVAKVNSGSGSGSGVQDAKTVLVEEKVRAARDSSAETANLTAEELRGMADGFGRLMPPGTFSPAEIQGFLLKRKKSPRRALDDAQEWIEATMKQKETRSKIVTVQ